MIHLGNIYAYKGKYWKPIHEFKYTGETVPFTLDKGKYLLICNGASGGVASINATNYGGTAMGVLTLNSLTNLYATVGGNGGAPLDNATPGVGGFNGGGNGGRSYNNAYVPGAGGGGASDIRIGSNSLYSRVIVAGGGGGGSNLNESTYPNFTGNGGGIVGGCVTGGVGSINVNEYSTQTSGYAFGIGMNAVDKTSFTSNGAEGASGGGGGWYGGYANGSSNVIGSSSNGGGGSGYVLTESSYKPDGYLLNDEYYLTDTFLNGGDAIESQVLVCVATKVLNQGDVIIFPCIGETEETMLFIGKYKLKCYGGSGGVRTNIRTSSKGGYAEGILDNQQPTKIFVNVGGSGLGTNIVSPTYAMLNRPTMMFNGGGSPGAMGTETPCGMAGGGASDIRIGSNSLYSRVIVAGGGGGQAYSNGGNGGGTVGGSHGGGYGTSPGPGTQTSSPQSTSYPIINGGFGYGGNGVNVNGGAGGAGGGGWYGGSGCRPDGSYDDDKGGCGGSGYVLTESSHKPDWYLLNDEYYLTDTILTQGGNNLPISMSRVEIEVIEVSMTGMLCHDADGYKRFDPITKRWVHLSNELMIEMFAEHGVYVFENDDGLLPEYDILIHDSSNDITGMSLNVSPQKQTITSTIESNMDVGRINIDAVCNTEVYNLSTKVSRDGVGSDTRLTLQIDIDKIDTSVTDKLKLYCVQLFSK